MPRQPSRAELWAQSEGVRQAEGAEEQQQQPWRGDDGVPLQEDTLARHTAATYFAPPAHKLTYVRLPGLPAWAAPPGPSAGPCGGGQQGLCHPTHPQDPAPGTQPPPGDADDAHSHSRHVALYQQHYHLYEKALATAAPAPGVPAAAGGPHHNDQHDPHPPPCQQLAVQAAHAARVQQVLMLQAGAAAAAAGLTPTASLELLDLFLRDAAALAADRAAGAGADRAAAEEAGPGAAAEREGRLPADGALAVTAARRRCSRPLRQRSEQPPPLHPHGRHLPPQRHLDGHLDQHGYEYVGEDGTAEEEEEEEEGEKDDVEDTEEEDEEEEEEDHRPDPHGGGRGPGCPQQQLDGRGSHTHVRKLSAGQLFARQYYGIGIGIGLSISGGGAGAGRGGGGGGGGLGGAAEHLQLQVHLPVQQLHPQAYPYPTHQAQPLAAQPPPHRLSADYAQPQPQPHPHPHLYLGRGGINLNYHHHTGPAQQQQQQQHSHQGLRPQDHPYEPYEPPLLQPRRSGATAASAEPWLGHNPHLHPHHHHPHHHRTYGVEGSQHGAASGSAALVAPPPPRHSLDSARPLAASLQLQQQQQYALHHHAQQQQQQQQLHGVYPEASTRHQSHHHLHHGHHRHGQTHTQPQPQPPAGHSPPPQHPLPVSAFMAVQPGMDWEDLETFGLDDTSPPQAPQAPPAAAAAGGLTGPAGAAGAGGSGSGATRGRPHGPTLVQPFAGAGGSGGGLPYRSLSHSLLSPTAATSGPSPSPGGSLQLPALQQQPPGRLAPASVSSSRAPGALLLLGPAAAGSPATGIGAASVAVAGKASAPAAAAGAPGASPPGREEGTASAGGAAAAAAAPEVASGPHSAGAGAGSVGQGACAAAGPGTASWHAAAGAAAGVPGATGAEAAAAAGDGGLPELLPHAPSGSTMVTRLTFPSEAAEH